MLKYKYMTTGMSVAANRAPAFDPLTAPFEEVLAWMNAPDAPREPSPELNFVVPQAFMRGRTGWLRTEKYRQILAQTAMPEAPTGGLQPYRLRGDVLEIDI